MTPRTKDVIQELAVLVLIPITFMFIFTIIPLVSTGTTNVGIFIMSTIMMIVLLFTIFIINQIEMDNPPKD